ncbi:MAG TPA: glycosyltransferase family 4 protein [Jatrophihabitans sp.]|nr:glycosyltransferase family 4 protein [Jatrophihabitans sp.]
MRIVHVSDAYLPRLGGIERHVHDLAARQDADGHDVSVLTTVAGTNGTPQRVEVIRPELRTPADATAMRHTWAPRAARLDALVEADVLHVHSSSVSPLAYLAIATARRHRVPTLVTMHSLLAGAAPVFRMADTVLGWKSDAVVWSAVSEAAAGPLRRALGAGRPVAVLGNAVDAAAWRTPPRPTDSRRIVIASVGRLTARKRPRQLLGILRRARAKLPPAIRLEAQLIGDGPLRGSLESYVDRHGMRSWVTLRGVASREQIRRTYHDVDLYVAPATLESFGIAALEARSAGLPVLARAQGGVADFVTHGLNGLLAADDAGMTDGIVQLARDPALRRVMRRHNRTVRPPFEWCDILPRTYALYERAVAGAGRRVRPPARSGSGG